MLWWLVLHRLLTFRGYEQHMVDAVADVSEQDLLLSLILQCRHRLGGIVYGHHGAHREPKVAAHLVRGEGPGQATTDQ